MKDSLIVSNSFLLAIINEEKVSYYAHLFRKCLHFPPRIYKMFMVETYSKYFISHH